MQFSKAFLSGALAAHQIAFEIIVYSSLSLSVSPVTFFGATLQKQLYKNTEETKSFLLVFCPARQAFLRRTRTRYKERKIWITPIQYLHVHATSSLFTKHDYTVSDGRFPP